jgi:hypothetical protein
LKLRLVILVLAVVAFASCSPLTRAATGHASPSPLPIATGDFPMYGHAADFSWMAGKVHRDPACLYLDFGNARQALWGGHIALNASTEQTNALRDGDTIVVKGELTLLAYGACGAPSYVVSAIEEH